MAPRFEIFPGKKLVGQHMEMSLSANATSTLWRTFMPRRKEIANRVSEALISMQVYHTTLVEELVRPDFRFVKWAAVEVSGFDAIPTGMEIFLMPSGLYAVFIHKGPASMGPDTFRYIFETWLPASGYRLDNRPHFEVLGDKYRNDDPSPEEEVWIPVTQKDPLTSDI